MRTDRQELKRSLMSLAAGNRGYFTAGEAVKHGYSYPAQKYHADRGNWVKVERGIYRLRDWPVADDDHLVRWSMWARGLAVVSHATALSAHGLGDVDPAQVHLSVPRTFRARAVGVVLHRDPVDTEQVEDRGGYRISNPARAIAECAQDGIAQDQIDEAVRDALAQGRTTKRRLNTAAATLGARATKTVQRSLVVAER